MSKLLRVLAVEDSEADTAALQAELKRAGFDAVVQRVDSLPAIQEAGEQNGRLKQELQAATDRLQKATAEIAALNKELEAFAYSVSHDLRAPLRAINAYSNIVIEDFSAQLPAEAQSQLQRIAIHATKMGELIEHLGDFSRVARQPMVKHPVRVSEVVREVIADLHRKQPERDLQIQIGDLPDCVADLALLKQLFVNLLSNAYKFTQHTPSARIEVGSRDERGEPIYFVKDNGVGFDMQYAEKLFTVFQRFHREEEFEGTGVGLAIVQRIVQRHDGRVWAEAEVNRGATFYFTLPG